MQKREDITLVPKRRNSTAITKMLTRIMEDGGVWELIQGEDFDCSMLVFRGCVSGFAQRKNLRAVSTIKGVPSGHILLRFISKGDVAP